MFFYPISIMCVQKGFHAEEDYRPAKPVVNQPVHYAAMALDVIAPLTLLLIGIFGHHLNLSPTASYMMIGAGSVYFLGNVIVTALACKATYAPRSFLIRQPYPINPAPAY